MDSAIKFRKFDGKAFFKYIATYALSVGGFNWAALALRVDFGFAMIKISRCSLNPGPQHFEVLDWLWGYIRKTFDYELVYIFNPKPLKLTAYVDSDWVGCFDTRRFTGAYLIFFGGCFIVWKSKLQSHITRFFIEAEYVQLSVTACELITYRRFCEEFDLGLIIIRVNDQEAASMLYGDN
jgi:hypothetical protein